MIPPRYRHQSESIAFLQDRPRTYDSSDAGTGKTRVAIEAFAARRVQGSGCALILAPRSLLRTAWEEDFRKYAPHLTLSIANAANREAGFLANADVYITNVDAARWLATQPASFWSRFQNGMLIVDEATKYKHHTSGRSKAINAIKGHFVYRHLMSGTPRTNSVCDLWHQYYLLDDGKRLGRSFYAFRAATCIARKTGPGKHMVKWVDRPDLADAVAKLIEDITIRHKFEDCIDIPPNQLVVRNYYMSTAQVNAYLSLEKEAYALINSEQIITAVHKAALRTKLLQVASGAVYDSDHKYAVVDTSRYELVADLVEEREHSIVFFLWTHQRDLLIKEFESRGLSYALIDGDTTDTALAAIVKHYQAGFYRVLLAHPLSAAHGLTLTRGTSCIWASPTIDLEWWIQGNRRIYRAGQTQRTETIVVIAKGTLEEQVLARLEEKNAEQLDLLDLLNARFAPRVP